MGITNKELWTKNVKFPKLILLLKEKQSEKLSMVTKKITERWKNSYLCTKTQYLIAQMVNEILIVMFMIIMTMMLVKEKSIFPHMLGKTVRMGIPMAREEKKLFPK